MTKQSTSKHDLTVQDIADELQCAKITVYRFVSHHGLPAYKVGGRLMRIRRADFEAWKIANMENAENAEPVAA